MNAEDFDSMTMLFPDLYVWFTFSFKRIQKQLFGALVTNQIQTVS